MQSKGAIRFVAILLLLASLWQLSFTFVANRQEKNAEKYAEAKAEAAMNAAAFGKVAEADKAFYLDSIRKVENRRYIDSISSEKIYLGYIVKDMTAFDLGNLRWNKVVICTDGDVDGFQIRTLILTMLYRLTPTLIREGYVYIAETPLFEINSGDKTWFAYSDKEKNDILKDLEGKKVKIDRSKGLGENDPDMMWLTTMNPETRRLIRVMPEDVERTAQVFDLLLGDNLQGRKNHIAENGYKYLEMADIS